MDSKKWLVRNKYLYLFSFLLILLVILNSYWRFHNIDSFKITQLDEIEHFYRFSGLEFHPRPALLNPAKIFTRDVSEYKIKEPRMLIAIVTAFLTIFPFVFLVLTKFFDSNKYLNLFYSFLFSVIITVNANITFFSRLFEGSIFIFHASVLFFITFYLWNKKKRIEFLAISFVIVLFFGYYFYSTVLLYVPILLFSIFYIYRGILGLQEKVILILVLLVFFVLFFELMPTLVSGKSAYYDIFLNDCQTSEFQILCEKRFQLANQVFLPNIIFPDSYFRSFTSLFLPRESLFSFSNLVFSFLLFFIISIFFPLIFFKSGIPKGEMSRFFLVFFIFTIISSFVFQYPLYDPSYLYFAFIAYFIVLIKFLSETRNKYYKIIVSLFLIAYLYSNIISAVALIEDNEKHTIENLISSEKIFLIDDSSFLQLYYSGIYINSTYVIEINPEHDGEYVPSRYCSECFSEINVIGYNSSQEFVNLLERAPEHSIIILSKITQPGIFLIDILKKNDIKPLFRSGEISIFTS